MILLDTHALLWWALDPDRLSPAAAELMQQMELSGGFASSISFWELGVKIARGKLDIGMRIDAFARLVEKTGAVEVVPVTTEIWLASLALPWNHRDPADRVIVATALEQGVPLATRDDAMRTFPGVRCMW